MKNRKLRMGMIGGGPGAFVGGIHRMAAALDGQIELVCGAFSADPARSIRFGQELFLAPNRCYGSFSEMIEKEAALSDESRMDFVSVVTPTHLHFEPVMLALEHHFPVLVEKPLCSSPEEAGLIQEKVREAKVPLAVCYNYTGYAMVKQARLMALTGEIGKIRKVDVVYAQGWLSESLEDRQVQARWRMDSKKSRSGTFSDIGVHAGHIVEYISGLRIEKVLADMHRMVPGRVLDDNGHILLQLENGVAGTMNVSQIAVGEDNCIRIKVYGENGGLEWSHSRPDILIVNQTGMPERRLSSGADHSYLHDAVLMHLRLPAGHPEGFIEAFANLYRNFAQKVRHWYLQLDSGYADMMDFPGIGDGVRGVNLVEAVVSSSMGGNVWTRVKV